MPTIKLQSSDGEVFPVDVDIARQSVTIRTMLEDLGMEEEEDEAVPLPNVNAAILKKVKNFTEPALFCFSSILYVYRNISYSSSNNQFYESRISISQI